MPSNTENQFVYFEVFTIFLSHFAIVGCTDYIMSKNANFC